jgi:DNA repair ATPase RecN
VTYSRFFLCDLHVHTPADHQHRYGNVGSRDPNKTFAETLVKAHAAAGVNVFAVTDHNRIDWWPVLSEAGAKHGVTVFPGMELSVNGCHLVAIWDCDPEGYRLAGKFLSGLFKPGVEPIGKQGPEVVTEGQVLELAKRVVDHRGLVFAAHSTMKGNGVFAKSVASNSADIAASELVTAFDVAGDRTADVLKNPRAKFGTSQPRWFISGDTRSLDDVGKRSLYLKLGERPTLEGLRQAFLAPATRVRFPEVLRKDWGHVKGVLFLNDPQPSWPRLVRLDVKGGFHDGLSIEFGPGLNALIGGKGTGKSALVEILRHVSGSPEAVDRELADNLRRNFPANADASLQFVAPDGAEYAVRRSGGSQAGRLSRDGRTVEVAVDRRLAISVFGQRELRALADRPDALRDFLAPLAGSALEEIDKTERSVVDRLRRSDASLTTLETELARQAESAEELADLEESLERAAAAKADELVRELERLESANRSVTTALAWPAKVKARGEAIRLELPAPSVSELVKTRDDIESALRTLSSEAAAAADRLIAAADAGDAPLTAGAKAWKAQYVDLRADLDARLAEAGIRDPKQYAELQGRAAELREALAGRPSVLARVEELDKERRELLSMLEDEHRKRSRTLESAARALNERVGPTVRVAIQPFGDRSRLRSAIEGALKGQSVRGDQIDRLASMEPGALAAAARDSDIDLEPQGVSASTSAKIRGLTPAAIRRVEEVDTPDLPSVEIDLGAGEWRTVLDVSPGQRATALLALALAAGSEPVVIDQPEDDLDNRFISQEIVPALIETCQRRQVIVATHNANIPVLGDAELFVAFDATADRSRVLAAGGLESSEVTAVARQILEGGEEAFQARRRRYLGTPG